jgi:23S rRNA (uracil-5-)-methyltransferase RumA
MVQEISNDECPNKAVCGSCEWSKYLYEDQLVQKIAGINTALSATGAEFLCRDIVPSPVISHYRNRMDFVIDYRGNFGLREKGKWWKVIDHHTCFIPDGKIINAFNKIYDWLSYWKNSALSLPEGLKPFFDRKTYEGLLRYAVIRSTSTGEIMITILSSEISSRETSEIVKNKILELKNVEGLKSLIWSTITTKSDVSTGGDINVIFGSNHITEVINGYSYIVTPNSFFQTNPYAGALLQQTVVEFAKEGGDRLLDLYCGSGFFTIPLAKIYREVTGIELSTEAIEDAKKNAGINNVTIDFKAQKAEDYKITLTENDVLLVDPPRSGLHKNVIRDILYTSPRKIIYVSCNYAQFAKELAIFKDKYVVTRMTAIDMFPQTPYVELVTLLEKRA